MYAEDLKALGLEGDMWKVATLWETPKEEDIEESKKLWDRAFNQPYEKAGGGVSCTLDRVASVNCPVYWKESYTDVNTKYKSLLPRSLLEVTLLFPPLHLNCCSYMLCVMRHSKLNTS